MMGSLNPARSVMLRKVCSKSVPGSVRSGKPRLLLTASTAPRRNIIVQEAPTRMFSAASSESKGFFGGIRDRFQNTMKDRTENRKKEKTKEQIETLAGLEVWNLKAFVAELDRGLSDWTTKIPGMGSTKQVAAMKENKKLLDAFVAVVGEDAQVEDLVDLGRKEKLKICIEATKPLEDVNFMIQQFQTMGVMHRVIRHRKLNGKDIPTDEEGVKLVMQEDARKVISKKEMKEMRQMLVKQQGRQFRSR